MAIKLIVDNRHVAIKGASMGAIRALEKATSYLVAGFMFSPAFRAKKWDGREHLLKFSSKNGYRAPVGLLKDICGALRAESIKFELDTSQRGLLSRPVTYHWNTDIKLRNYQIEALDSVAPKGGEHLWSYGSGLLKMPIRSGKTKTAAGLIHRLGVRTLFIVPSQMLLHQTVESLQESLLGVNITKIGDGNWDAEGDIVVTTVQSLTRRARAEMVCKGNYDAKEKEYGEKKCACSKKKCKGGKKWIRKATPEYNELRKEFDCIIFDEAHHLRGDSWHGVVMDIEARYRLGLSATIYLDHEREVERGAIWLKACCGNILVDVDVSGLIQQGYLMKQNVELVPITEPADLQERRWSARLQDDAIYNNAFRNAVCALKTKEKHDEGMKIIVISRRYAQVNQLCAMIDSLGLCVEPITGKETSRRREQLVDGFSAGYTHALVGTVLGEGIDIPEAECVINAEGGRDLKATVQRQRNMTVSEGKERCVFVDMVDLTNEYFATHSSERVAGYRSEPEYEVCVTKLTPEQVEVAHALAEEFPGYE